MNAPASTSARGLFRATGKKSKPVAVRHLDGSYAKVDSLDRERDDFYPTPPEPVRAFIAAEKFFLSCFPAIWEPAAGDGAICRELNRADIKTIASDLVDRGCGAEIQSFYDFKAAPSPAIVTNPPFNECNARDGQGRWLWHALETLNIEYMALLLNWSWPGAGGHARLWKTYPPARVYLMRWKIDFTGQGQPPIQHGWFVWDKSAPWRTELLMLDKSDPAQSQFKLEGAA